MTPGRIRQFRVGYQDHQILGGHLAPGAFTKYLSRFSPAPYRPIPGAGPTMDPDGLAIVLFRLVSLSLVPLLPSPLLAAVGSRRMEMVLLAFQGAEMDRLVFPQAVVDISGAPAHISATRKIILAFLPVAIL